MESEVELVAIAGHQLKSFLLLRYADDLVKFVKFILVVAWGTLSCNQTDKGSVDTGASQLSFLVVSKDLYFYIITRIVEYSIDRLSDPTLGTF